MPVKRRRDVRQRRGWSDSHRCYLRSGHYFRQIERGAEFESEDEMREAWADLKDEITAKMILTFPGRRPYGFWMFDAPEQQQVTAVRIRFQNNHTPFGFRPEAFDEPWDNPAEIIEPEVCVLDRHGLLFLGELEEYHSGTGRFMCEMEFDLLPLRLRPPNPPAWYLNVDQKRRRRERTPEAEPEPVEAGSTNGNGRLRGERIKVL